jgi:hypothetical protein
MPIKIKKKKDKKQKQKQKQIVNQRVVVNLADTKPRRRVARRRPQVQIFHKATLAFDKSLLNTFQYKAVQVFLVLLSIIII